MDFPLDTFFFSCDTHGQCQSPSHRATVSLLPSPLPSPLTCYFVAPFPRTTSPLSFHPPQPVRRQVHPGIHTPTSPPPFFSLKCILTLYFLGPLSVRVLPFSPPAHVTTSFPTFHFLVSFHPLPPTPSRSRTFHAFRQLSPFLFYPNS